MNEQKKLHLIAKQTIKDSDILLLKYNKLKQDFYKQRQVGDNDKEILKKIVKYIQLIKGLEENSKECSELSEQGVSKNLIKNLQEIIIQGVVPYLTSNPIEDLGSGKINFKNFLKYDLKDYIAFPTIANQIVEKIQKETASMDNKTVKEYYTTLKEEINKIKNQLKDEKIVLGEAESAVNKLLKGLEQETSNLSTSFNERIVSFFQRQNIKLQNPNISDVYGQIGEHIVAIAAMLAQNEANVEIDKLVYEELLKDGNVTITGAKTEQQRYITKKFNIDKNEVEIVSTLKDIQIKTDVQISDTIFASVKNYNLQSNRDITLQRDVNFQKILSMKSLENYVYAYENFFVKHEDDDVVSAYQNLKKNALQTFLYIIIARAIAGGGMTNQSNLLVIMNNKSDEVYIIDIYDILNEEDKSSFISDNTISKGLQDGTLTLVTAKVEDYSSVYNTLMSELSNKKFDIYIHLRDIQKLQMK